MDHKIEGIGPYRNFVGLREFATCEISQVAKFSREISQPASCVLFNPILTIFVTFS